MVSVNDSSQPTCGRTSGVYTSLATTSATPRPRELDVWLRKRKKGQHENRSSDVRRTPNDKCLQLLCLTMNRGPAYRLLVHKLQNKYRNTFLIFLETISLPVAYACIHQQDKLMICTYAALVRILRKSTCGRLLK